jgi:hypothetical protein
VLFRSSNSVAFGGVELDNIYAVSNVLQKGNGGTGASTMSQFRIVGSGTSPSNPLEALDAGTTGQILKSNGTLAYPTFQTGAAGDVGLGNVTNHAQLQRADGDINSFTEKVTPISNDVLLIEDSAASYAKKKIKLSSLPSGSGDVTGPVTSTQYALSYFTDTGGNTLGDGGTLAATKSAPYFLNGSVRTANASLIPTPSPSIFVIKS